MGFTIDRIKLYSSMLDNGIPTVVELAKKSGLSRTTVTAMKCGKKVSGKSVYAIATTLGVKASYLIINE